MASNLQTLREELKIAREEGDLDKVAYLEAMIQTSLGNNPLGGFAMGQKIKSMTRGYKKGGLVSKKKKGKKVRGCGIAKKGTRKAKMY